MRLRTGSRKELPVVVLRAVRRSSNSKIIEIQASLCVSGKNGNGRGFAHTGSAPIPPTSVLRSSNPSSPTIVIIIHHHTNDRSRPAHGKVPYASTSCLARPRAPAFSSSTRLAHHGHKPSCVPCITTHSTKLSSVYTVQYSYYCTWSCVTACWACFDVHNTRTRPSPAPAIINDTSGRPHSPSLSRAGGTRHPVGFCKAEAASSQLAAVSPHRQDCLLSCWPISIADY